MGMKRQCSLIMNEKTSLYICTMYEKCISLDNVKRVIAATLHVFLAFDFCRFCVVIRFFHPRHNGQWPPTSKDFLSRFDPLHLFSYLISWERASIFRVECSVLNKGTTRTISITSLVWRGPWLGIEPGTSRTRSQHYTTRLSRRRFGVLFCCL